jgi:hypothetical protein
LPSISICSNHVAFQICGFTNGEDFRAGPNLTPDQHIYRAANPAWIPPPPPPQPPATVSKFTVGRHLHNGHDYWSPYDLLGLFLSLMGPAPNGATKRNFYLPMTAVYGRWCRQIAGNAPRNGICDRPYMFQCTWSIPSYPHPCLLTPRNDLVEDLLGVDREAEVWHDAAEEYRRQS